MEEKFIYYYLNGEGKVIASEEFTPYPLYKGMRIKIHGFDNSFKVVDWEYRMDHPDQKPGLYIFIERNL